MNPNDTPAKGQPKRQHTPEVTAYVVIAILSMLKTGSRMGSLEIHENLKAEHGINVSLRTIQRHLARLIEVFPVEADEKNPRGYRWANTEQAMVMRDTAVMMQEAA